MGTPWDAGTYDRTSAPQQEWAVDVLERLGARVRQDATVLDVGCGTGRVTERLLSLVPRGRVLAIDASAEMVALAQERLAGRGRVWAQNALDLHVEEPVDAIFSTAALHWVPDHERLWERLAAVLTSGGLLEVQCGGAGNIAEVRDVIEDVVGAGYSELAGFSPWVFATPEETERRLVGAGFTEVRCWLESRPTNPEDLDAFVRTSILAAHLERLPSGRREPFAAAVVSRVRAPLGYVRLNVSAVRV